MSSQSVATFIFGFLALSWVGSAVALWWGLRRIVPSGISRRVLRRPGRTITRRTGYAGGAWNPGKPLGRGNSTPNEPGWAQYRLTESGLVHLTLTRTDGRTEDFEGPPILQREQSARLGLIPVLIYAGSAVVGFGIGFTVGGRPTSHRFEVAVITGFAACVVAWIVLAIVGVRLRLRSRTAADLVT